MNRQLTPLSFSPDGSASNVVGNMQLTNKKNSLPARSSANGLSLIELLIVVGIILIIASIAIPNYLRSRMAANESSAVENLRTITTAQTIYNTTYGNGFSPNMAVLGGVLPANCNNAVLIDDVLAIMGVRSGYQFSYAADPAIAAAPPGCAIPGVNTFTVAATPLAVGSS